MASSQRKRAQTQHPLDRWVAGLREVTYKDLTVLVFDDAESEARTFASPPNAQQAIISMMVSNPDPRDLAEFLEDEGWIGDDIISSDVTPTSERRLRELAPDQIRQGEYYDEIAKGSELPLVAPQEQWRVTFGVQGALLWTWDWTLTELTDDMALLSASASAFGDFLPPFRVPLGLVPRADSVRGTCLLCLELETAEQTVPELRRFGEDNFWSSLGFFGISIEDLYRILLCWDHRGGRKLINMSVDELMEYREHRMVRGFKDVLAATRNDR